MIEQNKVEIFQIIVIFHFPKPNLMRNALLFMFLSISLNILSQMKFAQNTSFVNDSALVANLIKQSITNSKKDRTLESFDQNIGEALLICQKNGFLRQEAYIYNLIGKREREKSNYASSIEYCSKAVQIADMLQDPLLQAEYNNQLGVVFRRIDEHVMATNAHMKGLKYAEMAKDSFNISVSLNSLGNIKLSLGQNNTAIEYFRQSLILSEDASKNTGIAMNTNNIGEAYMNLKMADSALHYFYKSLDYNERINSEVGQAISFSSIGNVYIEKKDYNKALDYLNKSLILHNKIGDLVLLSVAHFNLGKVFLKSGDNKKAISHLESALAIARKSGSKYNATEASKLLAETYEKTGSFDQAFTLLKLSTVYRDSLINEKNLQHMVTMELMYDSEKKDQKISELNRQAQETNEKIYKQKFLFIFIFSILALSIVITLLVFYQFRLKTDLRSIQNKQRLLRLQMNPHFVFNALSAVQLYILDNDQDKSSELLNSFSKLMRRVLQSSNHEFISLDEELTMIREYLNVQQLRFLEPFQYNLTIGEGLDVSQISIPPMITQPFIENAIEHGFTEINQDCEIVINFMKHEKSMVIEVSDNGIGINNCQQKSPTNHHAQHQSMATKITKERLMILEKELGTKTSIELIDKGVNQQSKGTLIRITIPYLTAKV